MQRMRYSTVSIDSLIDSYATSMRSTRDGSSTTETANVGPQQHHPPWQTSTTSISAVPEGNPSLVSASTDGDSVETLNNVSQSHPSFARRVRRMWYYGWVAESLGCSLAVLALIATVITLRLHEDKTLPEWPFSISINSLIAIFGVLLKAGATVALSEGISQLKWQWFEAGQRSLIDLDGFDAASRGPWGSFLLLFTWHGGAFRRPNRLWLYPLSLAKFISNLQITHLSSYFAKFAAFLTVLLIAVDPFTQQIVQIVNCPQVSAADQAFVARTNGYYAQGGHIGASEADIDSPMAASINTGLVNPPEHIPSLVSTGCKSGNCTFENFASVSFCRACEDISSQIQNMTGYDGSRNYTLPGDADSKYGFPILSLYHQYSFRTSAIYSETPRLLDLRLISHPEAYGGVGQPSAFHCSITLCVVTYSSSIVQGNLVESELSSVPMGFNLNMLDDQIAETEVQGRGLAFFRLATSRTLRNGTEKPCLPSDEENPGLLKVAKGNIDAAPDSSSVTTDNATATAWYPTDCVWSFGQGSAYAIRDTLVQELDDLEMQATSGVTVGPLAAKNMWRNGTVDLAHINDYLQKLADVMTATVRNRGWHGRDEYARGNVVIVDSCLQVRWAWLAYPAALVGLTICFLTAMVIQGPRGSARRVWKSSILAPLFISMDDKVYDVNYYEMSKRDMNELAEAIQTQLVRDPEGKAKFL
ncbi:hypothetical protein F5Y17DRAFT_83149 [Xylariaceae sp. FL0594]|nr:hypothetical protein F5Y17DRAFT_83149 [Xylariaceae sp. FL0594]